MSEKSFKRSPSREPKSEEEDAFQIFCKQMVKTRVFRGYYQERRYVEQLKGHRDVIVIDKQEREVIKHLVYVKNRIHNFYEDKDLWVGVSLPDMIGTPAASVCIWTEVSNIPFGTHWFYIKSMKFRDNEVIIKVTSLRFDDDDGYNTSTKSFSNKSRRNEDDDTIPSMNNYIALFNFWMDSVRTSLFTFLSRDVNRANIIAILKFIALVMVSLAVFTIEAIKIIGIYGLKFMEECRLWIHTSTPIILKLIDLLTKVIGGIFIFLTMLWRDLFGGRIQQPNNNEVIAVHRDSPTRHRLSGQEYYRYLYTNKRDGNVYK